MCKKTHFRCNTVLHLKSSLKSHCSTQKKIKCMCLRTPESIQSAPSPFSQEGLASVPSVARTRHPVPSVGRATPGRCCRSANSPGNIWLAVESVQRTELLPQLLVKVVMVTTNTKLRASFSTCTWFFAHWSNLWENFSGVRLYDIENEQQHLAAVPRPTIRTRSDRLTCLCRGPNRCQNFFWKWWWCRWKL